MDGDLILSGTCDGSPAPYMAPVIRSFLNDLSHLGIKAWVVGGAVRDAILGLKADDLDFAMDVDPDTFMARFPGRIIPGTGHNFGTVRVKYQGRIFEITALRRDINSDGRRPRVIYTQSINDDALRRDFTINALYLDADCHLSDPTGLGLDDLKAGRLKFIGSPQSRLKEDHLRSLRFFRFLATRPFLSPDKNSLKAALDDYRHLQYLSAERRASEMARLLEGEKADKVIMTLLDTPYLEALFGKGADRQGFLRAFAMPKTSSLELFLWRLAGFFPLNEPSEIDRLVSRFRLSRHARRQLEWMAHDETRGGVPKHNDPERFLVKPNRFNGQEKQQNKDLEPLSLSIKSEKALRRLKWYYGQDGAEAILCRRFWRSKAPVTDTAWHHALKTLSQLEDDVRPYAAKDLIQLGFKADKTLGAALKHMDKLWCAEGMPQQAKRIKDLLHETAHYYKQRLVK